MLEENHWNHGTANNITVGKQELDMRLPAMNSFIQDLRVPEPAVLYKITNRVVPNPDSPEAVTIRERAVSRMARQVEIENEKAHLAMVARKRENYLGRSFDHNSRDRFSCFLRSKEYD